MYTEKSEGGMCVCVGGEVGRHNGSGSARVKRIGHILRPSPWERESTSRLLSLILGRDWTPRTLPARWIREHSALGKKPKCYMTPYPILLEDTAE